MSPVKPTPQAAVALVANVGLQRRQSLVRILWFESCQLFRARPYRAPAGARASEYRRTHSNAGAFVAHGAGRFYYPPTLLPFRGGVSDNMHWPQTREVVWREGTLCLPRALAVPPTVQSTDVLFYLSRRGPAGDYQSETYTTKRQKVVSPLIPGKVIMIPRYRVESLRFPKLTHPLPPSGSNNMSATPSSTSQEGWPAGA